MQVLLTNDDGIEAEGLQAMRRALVQLPGVELAVIAPDGNRSAFARMITTRRPLWVQQVPFEDGTSGFATDGTPVDCVRLAMLGLIEGFDADIVVSGINHGSNLGDDITYSGTVAAALEALVLGTAGDRGLPAVQRARDGLPPGQPLRLRRAARVRRARGRAARRGAAAAGHAAEHQRPGRRARRRPGHAPGQARSTATSSSSTPRTRTAAGATGSTAPTRASTTSRGHRPRRRRGRAHRGHARCTSTSPTSPGLEALPGYDLARLLAPGRPRGASERRPSRRERAAELRDELEHHGHRYYVLDDPEIGDDAVRRAARRAARDRGASTPSCVTPDSPTQRVGGEPVSTLEKVAPPPADALAGQRAQRGGAARVDRADAQPPRARGHRGPRVRVRRRAEDRRAGDLADLPRRRARARRHARQRRGRRGRHPQPAHDPGDPAALDDDDAAGAARGARRGLHVARRLRRAQRAPRRGRACRRS